MRLFIVPVQKWRQIVHMINDRPIDRLSYQWQASIHFNWPVVCQYDGIFRHYKKLFKCLKKFKISKIFRINPHGIEVLTFPVFPILLIVQFLHYLKACRAICKLHPKFNSICQKPIHLTNIPYLHVTLYTIKNL